MTTLIIPCAGKSARFPGMKPKWLLTHPSGRLMIFEGTNNLDQDGLMRIIITVHRSHLEEYDADLILKQAAPFDFELCILDEWTQGPAETISHTITKMNITGAIIIKDSDSSVVYNSSLLKGQNFVIGANIYKSEVRKPEAKSFVIKNEDNLISDIVEKEIVSGEVCVGVYGIESAEEFKESFLACLEIMEKSEIFISHVISYSIKFRSQPFEYLESQSFEDWGTSEEWYRVQRSMPSIFSDFDGVLVENSGKYGEINWNSKFTPIERNIEKLYQLSKNGGQIVITTSRDSSFEPRIREFLSRYGLEIHQIVTNLNHAPRILINDFAPTNPYPSAVAVNLPRNGSLEEYFTN